MRVASRLAAHRTFAANVERLQRIQLPGVRNADAHAELLHARSDRRSSVPSGRIRSAGPGTRSKFGRTLGDRHGVRRKLERRTGANGARRGRNRRAVLRHKRGAHAVVGSGAFDIRLHDVVARGLTALNRAMHIADAGFFDAECPALRRGQPRCECDEQCRYRHT